MTKILVVDDEPDVEVLICQKFAAQIQTGEFEFIFAPNGQEALRKLHLDPEINILLTDINMPIMDGLTLLSHLSELKRIIKAVIISAYGDLSNIRKAMNQGACDFVTKPIDFKDLEITIHNAIHLYRDLEQAAASQLAVSILESELTIANHIQQSIIPHVFTPFPGNQNFEIYGAMIPAKHVGGDFFDFFPLDESHLAFVIADVSGKGIPAAIFMAICRTIVRTIARKTQTTAEALFKTNQLLCIDNDACMFVTNFCGIYEITTGKIVYSNAGHPPPILLKSNGTVEFISRNEGIPLGVQEESTYKLTELTLDVGDCLIMYTDGITEAMTLKNELYTEERFSQDLKKWAKGPLPTLTAHILASVNQFTQGAPLSDDMTLLCLRQLK